MGEATSRRVGVRVKKQPAPRHARAPKESPPLRFAILSSIAVATAATALQEYNKRRGAPAFMVPWRSPPPTSPEPSPSPPATSRP